jgi:mono/diheme cytochrome c family protein
MKKYNMLFILLLITLLAYSCKEDVPNTIINPVGTSPIPASEQRTGNTSEGYDYLVYGNYVGSGIPFSAFTLAGQGSDENLLNRTGDNAEIPHDFTAIDAANGIRVVSANCLQCHSQKLNGEFIVGLGSSISDFTGDQSELIPAVDFALELLYGNDSPEWEAYEPFRRAVLATGPQLITDVVGVNPADKLAVVLAAHRNNNDLSWIDEPALNIPTEVVPTDVPAWWLLKKKNAMFYNGVGRGDFARIMMASSLLTMQDTAEARIVDDRFADVLAFINSIEAPSFPETLDSEKVTKGKAIFEGNCSGCHGTYGNDESYPNLLVDLDRVGTDPVLAQSNFAYTDFIDWYNTSWFAQAPYAAQMVPADGYVAPPLDGVWATAPYLHNGSVPDLATLLNSGTRPSYWRKTLDTNDYNLENVGWNYTAETSKVDNQTYDVSLLGYGNGGHTFGDVLSDEEREDLIEYLKGL